MSVQFDYKLFRREWDTLLERRKYKQAEKLCHEGLAQSPLDASRGKLYNHLGYLYENFLDDKTFDDILEHYVLSLQVDETNANSHYNLSNFLLEQGMQHLLRALELNPAHAKATKRFKNLTPIKVGETLELNGQGFQVTELTEDGIKAVLLNDDGGKKTYDITIGSSLQSNSATANNTNTHHKPEALEIEQPPNKAKQEPFYNDSNNNNNNNDNNSKRSNGNGNPNNSCCTKCTLQWWVWLLFWILALGGVALPILTYYMEFFQDCENREIKVSHSELSTENELNIAIFLDCASTDDEFQQQLSSASDIVTSMLDSAAVVNDLQMGIYQTCEPNTAAPIAMTSAWTAAQITSIAAITKDTSAAVITGLSLNTPLTECASIKSTTTPVLSSLVCLFMITAMDATEFVDATDAIATASDATENDIFYAFLTYDSDLPSADLNSLLNTFGSNAGGSATVNDWTTLDFGDDDICPHCINVNNSSGVVGSIDAVIVDMADSINEAFVAGVQQTTYTDGDCSPLIYYYLYAIGGVIPLLIWVLAVMINLCCNGCKSKKRRQNMEDSLANNDDPGQEKQSAYV